MYTTTVFNGPLSGTARWTGTTACRNINPIHYPHSPRISHKNSQPSLPVCLCGLRVIRTRGKWMKETWRTKGQESTLSLYLSLMRSLVNHWFSSRVLQSGHALLTLVGSMCSCTLPCILSLVPSVLHLSHGFQCSRTLNRQPYEGRLPLTSWWRKSSDMTVGQSSLIFLAHHCYDWHLLWLDLQPVDIKVDGGITGSRLRWSILT